VLSRKEESCVRLEKLKKMSVTMIAPLADYDLEAAKSGLETAPATNLRLDSVRIGTFLA